MLRRSLATSNIIRSTPARTRRPELAFRSQPFSSSQIHRSLLCKSSRQIPCKDTARPRTRLYPRRYSQTTTASQSTTINDTSCPDIFYHLVNPPTPASYSLPSYAVSFLPSPPPFPESSVIIGWLPSESAGNENGAQEAGLNDLKENPKFRDILHQAIQAGLRDGVDEIQSNGAIQLKQGWMHIHDERNIPALGRIGDPDDILGSVLVEDGRILPETYQPMPSYRICTADGLTQLTPGLASTLQAILVQRAESERARK